MNKSFLAEERILRITVQSDGTLCNISSKNNIPDKFAVEIDKITTSIGSVLEDRPYAVYLRGSLAYGRFLLGISDVDIIVIVPDKRIDDAEKLSKLAAKCSHDTQSWCSMVDISIYTPEEVLLPENNRLYMNITLTGVLLYSNDFIPDFPQPVLGFDLKRKIIQQTLNDCRNTLKIIHKHEPVSYMGKMRGADFLCVWFMRDLLRGTIAFVMEEQRCLSLNVQSCAALFVRQYPEYADLTEQLCRAECSPVDDWDELESLADKAMNMYISLADQTELQQ